jgi:hypothetical protein
MDRRLVSFSFSSQKTKYKPYNNSSFGRENKSPNKRRSDLFVPGFDLTCKDFSTLTQVVKKRKCSNYGNQSKSTFTSPNKQTSSDKQKFTPLSAIVGKIMGVPPSPSLTGVPSQMDEEKFELFKPKITTILAGIGRYVMGCKGSRSTGVRHSTYSSTGPEITSDLDLYINLESPQFCDSFIKILEGCRITKRTNAELHYDQYLLDPTNPFHLKPLKELGFDQANINELSQLLKVKGTDLLVKWSIMINIPKIPIECVTESSLWAGLGTAFPEVVIGVSSDLQQPFEEVEEIYKSNRRNSSKSVLTASKIQAIKHRFLSDGTNTPDASDESDPKGKLNFNQI